MKNGIPRTSQLVQRISTALEKYSFEHVRLRVSVAKQPKWEQSHKGDEVLVRWICWSIETGDIELTPPEFEVVSKNITEEILAHDLPVIFDHIEVLVDSDIDM